MGTPESRRKRDQPASVPSARSLGLTVKVAIAMHPYHPFSTSGWPFTDPPSLSPYLTLRSTWAFHLNASRRPATCKTPPPPPKTYVCQPLVAQFSPLETAMHVARFRNRVYTPIPYTYVVRKKQQRHPKHAPAYAQVGSRSTVRSGNVSFLTVLFSL